MATESSWFSIAGLVATWLAAIGTTATAITSLYLAREPYRVKLKAGARVMVSFTIGEPNTPHEEFAQIDVINQGMRTAHISAFGWEIGRFKKKQHFAQTILPPHQSVLLPKALAEGESCSWRFPLVPWVEQWTHRFNIKRRDLDTLRMVVFTTYGTRHKVKPDRTLIDRIAQGLDSSD